jgi:hypothetical protein
VAILLGAALGVTAWGEGRVPVLALTLPLFVAFAKSRLQAFAVGAGYAVGMLRYAAGFVSAWFDDSVTIGIGVVLVYALCTGLVWCVGWSASVVPSRKALAITAAWILALVPPFCVAVPGHPLVAAGYLMPGAGWLGAFLGLAAPAAAVWVLSHGAVARRTHRWIIGTCACGLAGAGIALHEPPPIQPVRGVQPVRTQWGGLRSQDDALQRTELIGRVKAASGTATLVWPESILGRYEPSMYFVLDIEALQAARSAGLVQVIGMDIPLQGKGLLNSAVAFYPDGSTATAVARQPAPISLWRPWRATDTYVASWAAHNMLKLGQGDRAAVIFCYEEYLPVLYLLNEALDRPTMYLALANTWAARDATSSAIQTWHSLGMAKLFARDYLKAENRPAAGMTNWSPSVAN